MLVLSRKPGEKIVIDNRIVLEILEVSGSGQVRLGILAPKDVKILRQELLEQAAEPRQQG